VLSNVEDIPEATPLLITGTEFIIDAIFGDMNNPPPIPTKIIGITNIL
jgi:hypothetical protein